MAIDVKKSLVPVVKGEVQLGVPLPYSVFDRNGVLLLRRGFRINLQRHLDILQTNGLFYEESYTIEAKRPRSGGAPAPVEVEQESTFELVESTKLRLGRLLDQFRAGRGHEGFLRGIEEIGVTLQEACTHDTDAVLASLHLDYDLPYEVVHHVKAGVICELVGKRLGVGEAARLTLIQAAITHDIGLIDIQEELDRQATPLSEAQQARIRSHPEDGVRILRELGVSDPAWLDPVRHHHERIDGSGYPDGLKGDEIRIPVRVLAAADNYSAMVRDRPYRKAMLTRTAMRELMLDDSSRTDRRLIEAMIKEIGVFPPGIIVRLASGEVAVVRSRGRNSAVPEIHAFVRADGMPMLATQRRDPAKAEFAIQGILPFSDYRGCVALIRSLWIPKN
jgi:HD-GYP domain-containing protein (c-di-GMP phosphodiesterase class II)